MIRTAWTLGAVLAGLALVFATYSQTWRSAMKAPPLDLVVDWGGAKVLLDGGDPFDEADVEASGVADHLRQLRLRPGAGLAHPPTAFVWFLPLAAFPLAEARVIWAHLTLLFAFLLALLAARELALPSPLASALLLFGWIGTSSWFEGHLAVGQLSVLLALLITLGWSRWRIGDELGGGACLGLACTLKVFPAAIVLYFLVARRFRLVAAAVGAWLLVAIPVTLHVGLDDWGRFLSEAGEYTDQWIGHVRNGSLLGVFQRARHSVCELPAVDHPVWPVAYLLAAGVAAAGILWLVRRRADVGAIAFSILVSPYAWEHYKAVLVVPFVVAVALVIRRGWRPKVTVPAALALLAVAWLLRVDWVAASRALHEYRQDPASGCLEVELLAATNWLPAVLLTGLLGLLQKGAGDTAATR